MTPRKIVIAGGTGFVGTSLAKACRAAGYEVVTLSRRANDRDANTVVWDGRSLGDWVRQLNGAYGLINLAGEPISLKWTGDTKRRILESRVESTRVLCEAVSQVATPPVRWINASAVGYYGDRQDEVLDESSSAGTGFLADVCRQWEAAFFGCDAPAHKTAVRFGMVLGKGGALTPLRKLAKFGLAGTTGSGDQYVSWIHIEDLCGIVLKCLEGDAPAIVNATSPQPLKNYIFMAAVRKAAGARFGLPAPAFAVRLVGNLLGPGPDLVLHGARVMPKAMIDRSYLFRFASVESALEQAFS